MIAGVAKASALVLSHHNGPWTYLELCLTKEIGTALHWLSLADCPPEIKNLEASG